MTGFKVYQHLESKDNPKISANFEFKKEKIMKTIIAGSRGIKDMKIIINAIEKSGIKISTVLSGRAKGVDILGELWAMENNIPVESFLPDWKRFGRGAGLKRNIEMINSADAFVRFAHYISKTVFFQLQLNIIFSTKLFIFSYERFASPVHYCHLGWKKQGNCSHNKESQEERNISFC